MGVQDKVLVKKNVYCTKKNLIASIREAQRKCCASSELEKLPSFNVAQEKLSVGRDIWDGFWQMGSNQLFSWRMKQSHAHCLSS